MQLERLARLRLGLRRGSLRSALRSERRLVEAAGVELDSLYFPQIVVCRAFLLIFSQLEHFFQSSISKISSIIPSKIKIFYTKFTPRVKFLKSHITILQPKTCQMIFYIIVICSIFGPIVRVCMTVVVLMEECCVYSHRRSVLQSGNFCVRH